MPQGQKALDDWQDLGLNDWQDLTPKEDKAWYEDIFTIPNAIRFGSSAVGTVAGALAAPYTFGGSLALIGGGGALGEGLARWYEGKPFDPTITAVEGALNLLPGGGAVPGKGAALKEIVKYGARQAGHGAWQGAVGAFPRHLAEQGTLYSPSEWEAPSLGDIASQTVGGAVIGGATGGALGAGNVARANIAGRPRPVGDMSGYKQPELPLDWQPQQETLIPHPIHRYDELADLGVRDVGQQTELDALRQQLGVDQRTTPLPPGINPFTGKFRKIPIGPPEQQSFDLLPQAEETGQIPLFGDQTIPPPPAAAAPPPPPGAGGGVAPTTPQAPITDIPPGTSLSPNQQVVTITAPNAQNVEYWRSKGYVPIMGLVDANGRPQMVRGDIAPLYVTGDKRPSPGGPPARQVPTGRPELPGPIGGEEIGFVPGQPIEVPNARVNKTFIENMKANGMGVGTVGATHTRFEPIIDQDVPHFEGTGEPPDIPMGQWPPGQGPFVPPVTQPDAVTQAPGLPTPMATRGQPNVVPGMNVPPPPSGPQPVQGALPFPVRPQMDPRMAARVEAGGPRTFDFTQPPPEQGHLFPMEVAEPDRSDFDADLRAIRLQQAADRFKRPYVAEPQQQSMIPDFQDAEIGQFLESQGIDPRGRSDPFFGGEGPSFERREPNIEVRRIPDSRNFGIYVDGRLHEGYFSSDAALRGAENLRRELNPNYKTKADLQWEADVAKMSDDELQRRRAMLMDREDYENPDIGPAIKAIDDEVARRGGGPEFARVKGGGLTASVNIKRAVENITRDYTSPLPAIMNREGMQNGLDAADKLGPKGEVRVRLNAQDNTIEISDNGSGLDEDGLSTKLVEIFATGKEGEAGATGGKGIGSASYIYGGEHFEVDTIAVDRTDGKKYRIVASGTPDQFLDPVKGSDFDKTLVDKNTPTGTTIKVVLKPDQDLADASGMIRNIVDNSRNRPSKVLVDTYGSSSGDLLRDADPKHFTEHKFASSKDDKMVGDFTTVNRNSEIKVLIPKGPTSGTRTEINIHYLNNGMYQFSETMHVGEAEGVPEKVLVDIHPLVDDLNDLYPFINTREDIKRDIRAEVTKFITDNIKSPAVSKRKNRVQELYDSMSFVPAKGIQRKTVIYDPGNRLTKQEMRNLTANPTIQNLVRVYDAAIANILNSTGRQPWIDRVEGVGIVLDPNMHGVHIPNPTTGKSTILINPFERIASEPPGVAAWNNTITNLHEVGHVGKEHGTPIQLQPQDLQDPRLGEFLSSYMNQLVKHGDIGLWTSTGHGMDFAHRLGEVYAKFGVENTFNLANSIRTILTGGQQSGGYSSEVQRLLQLYQESRGRAATTEDLLSGTGVKQTDTRPTGEGGVPSDNQADGTGIVGELNRLLSEEQGATPIRDIKDALNAIKKKTGIGQGVIPGGKPKPPKVKGQPTVQETNYVKEILAVPTNATTMLDLSAPGRQGLSMILTPEFWKAVPRMFGALHYNTYKQIDANLRSKPIMQEKIDLNTGKRIPSFAEQIGTKIFSPASEPGPRAEMTASKWLEMGVGDNIGAKIWRHTAGYPIRATNRAFITFLNHLNVNRTEKLLNLARDMSERGLNTGRTAMPGMLGGAHLSGGRNIGFTQAVTPTEAMNLNPYHNIVLAKEIAEFVNAATGHATPTNSLEKAVSAIGPVLFSPGLLNSRIRMMNPATYVMASPFVRKQYAKAALSTAAAWYVMSQLAKNSAGEDAEVSNDPTSADFGKVRVGDARLDLGGGFLQFAVAYGRAYMGGSTSSASGEFHRFGSGYQAQTQEDMMERFMVNKLNPVAKFAWDVYSASEYNPFHVGDRTAQLFIPLFIQDLNEIHKENPDLLPMFGTAAMFGGGTQIYGKGESVAKVVPEENDWLVTGGGLRDLMPWNWGNDPGEESRPFPWSDR